MQKSKWLFLLFMLPLAVQAETFVVDHWNDGPDANANDGVCFATGFGCTLRAAVEQANVWPGGPHVINVPRLPAGQAPSVSSELGPICITTSMTVRGSDGARTLINGIGAGGTILSACGGGDILVENFDFRPFGSAGFSANSPAATVTIRDAVFVSGPGGYSPGLDVADSTVHCEQCDFNGGASPGIVTTGSAHLSLFESKIHNIVVTAASEGGGMRLSGGEVHLVNSIVESNRVLDTSGGQAIGDGGGIYANGTRLVLLNSTISRNQAARSGGGIWFKQGQASIRNSTIAFNIANANREAGSGDWFGGGIFIGDLGIVQLANTILSDNEAFCLSPSTPGCSPAGFGFECTGLGIDSAGHNLLFRNEGCSIIDIGGATDILGVPSLLSDGLINNGGPTFTHSLLEGSPAIDGGNPAGCRDDFDIAPSTPGDLVTEDQRGINRPQDGDNTGGAICDIGAYEVMGVVLPDLIFKDGFD